jgi:hypothetical protein
MNADRHERRIALADAIDRHGADFNSWPAPAPADEARAAVLADRTLGAYRDDALKLARNLAEARAAADGEIAASGAVERVRMGALAGIAARNRRVSWMAVAATLVLAAGLGGLFDLAVIAPQGQPSRYDVVNIDPLGLGVAEDAIR